MTSAEVPLDAVVVVRRQWNDSLRAAYRLSDIEGLHWSDISGGVHERANRPYVHGYVMCDAMVGGEIGHSCRHGQGPHRIKVCIVAVDNGGTRSAVVRHVRQAATANDDERSTRGRVGSGESG